MIPVKENKKNFSFSCNARANFSRDYWEKFYKDIMFLRKDICMAL